MNDQEPSAERKDLLERRSTRRALLAGTATVAAAGTAVAIVGVAQQSGGNSKAAAPAGTNSPSGASTTPAGDPNAPITDARQRAAHLLRRAGFGGTLAQIDEFSKLSREDAADRLLNFDAVDNSALDGLLKKANYSLDQGKPADMIRWWLTRMAYTARPLEERMTLIWHGLLTSQISKIGGQRAKLMVTQNELFRANALPRYDDLLKAVGKDPAMLIYLDNIDSTKAHPNENYARESMELFTLGVGNYSENDVRESARAFTGWRLTKPDKGSDGKPDYVNWNPQFLISAKDHDSGSKTFLGQTGNWGGDDIVDIIMQQPAAGRFITTRLFTEFANYNPQPATIDRLVGVWNSSKHDIKAIVRAILVSDEFYSQASYRGFVRSPIEFVVNAVRGLEIVPGSGDRLISQKTFQGMDQIPFEPPSVAGWPGGQAWMSSSTFFARVNFLDQYLFGGNGKNANVAAIPALSGAATPDDMVERALSIFVDNNINDSSRASITAYAKTLTNPREQAAAVSYLVLASPEYQLI
jgi:uncharacterized protein (DUF1800 family)